MNVLPALQDGASTAAFPSPIEGSGTTWFDWTLGHRARRAQRLSIPALQDGAARRFLVSVLGTKHAAATLDANVRR